MKNTECERLPRPEMVALVKTHMRYADICEQLQAKTIRGSLVLLDRIVQMIVDLQYRTGLIEIRGKQYPAEEIAGQILQLKRHEVQYIMMRLCSEKAEVTDEKLLAELFFAVDSWGAWKYAQRHKMKIR